VRNELAIKKLSNAIHERYGAAVNTILVFGSVARNVDTTDSDIDVMVVLDPAKQPVDWRTERELRSMALAVELAEDVVFDLKVVRVSDLHGLRGHTPFMERVLVEGVRV
jgi:predicted nucleotidyltransferase